MGFQLDCCMPMCDTVLTAHILYPVLHLDPKKAPLLPQRLVGAVSRFAFHALLLPLIYSTIAMTVTIESIGDYWFVVVGAFIVLGVSYLVATLMQCCIPIANQQDFRALRISVTFPNIVALPILIFPSLCEFPLVNEGYMRIQKNEEELNPQELEEQCVSQSNTMIFCYFFSYMFLFWGLGYPQLMNAARSRVTSNNNTDETELSRGDESKASSKAADGEHISTGMLTIDQEATEQHDNNDISQDDARDHENDVDENEDRYGVLKNIWNAFKQTFTSPGFIATILGFVTACIPPLQSALFEPGEPLRFLGSAVETLGIASSSISTMIVAASLVPPIEQDYNEHNRNEENLGAEAEDNAVSSDNDSGAHQRRMNPNRSSRMRSFGTAIRRKSTRIIKSVTRSTPEMRRLHAWFCLSRLVVSPAVVVGIIVAIDCGSDVLRPVPKLALLVIIINSCLPGASIVVVLLKSELVLEDTAAVVAKAYLVSYIICIFTIAAWTALGLWITLPDEDGNTVCQRS
jgi:predicted permease